MPLPLRCFFLTGKKRELSKLEEEYNIQIAVIADGRLRPDEYDFEIEEAPKEKFEPEDDSEISSGPTLLETDEPEVLKERPIRVGARERLQRIKDKKEIQKVELTAE